MFFQIICFRIGNRIQNIWRMCRHDKLNIREKFYFCANANEDENEFETGAMTNRNLLNARNAYRIKMGLPISNEINIIYNGMRLQNN